MISSSNGRSFYLLAAAAFILLLTCRSAWSQTTGGSISGTVTDPAGGVVPAVAVTAVNLDTTVQQSTTTNAQGFYAFPNLAVGRYEVEVNQPGFQAFRRTGLVVDIGTQLRADVALTLNTQKAEVVVTTAAEIVQPETQETQMGETVPAQQVESTPLNGRAFTDILDVQAGVIPVTTQPASNVNMAGITSSPPGGNLNPGNVSVNGQQETANGFIVNGSDVEEDINMGTAVIPNLDSIDEFRIITNNFDAKYGNFSGGQIIVTTKSGTNAIHGDVFDFVRNTALDAKYFFANTTPAYDQQQFGGTVGGPLKKNKVFWFADYQGTRATEGEETGAVTVPSNADRTGNLSDMSNSFQTTTCAATCVSTPTSFVSTPYIASMLSGKLGYSVTQGEAYYYTGCTYTGPNPCVFPGLTIPTSAWSTAALGMLKYIPTANAGAGIFESSSENETIRDDKGSIRMDANTRWGNLLAYYFADNANVNNPYPTGQGGANVPNGAGGTFNSLTKDFTQLITLGDVKTFGTNWVNEFHFSFMRNYQNIGTPSGGVGVSLACQGIDTAIPDPLGSAGCTTPTGTVTQNGVYPLNPSIEGVENVELQNLGVTIGTPITNSLQVGNTYQWLDNVSKIVGTHTLTFGSEFHLDQINESPNATPNGSFLFDGGETGSDFADFLLGIASGGYVQADQGNFYPRNYYIGLFAQDSWRARHNLTLNYGLRWEVLPPWREKRGQLSGIVPGQQSVVFPGAPDGFDVPGDPGVPETIAPIQYNDFAPRVGIAYAPDVSDPTLQKIFGKSGQSSIRAGFSWLYTMIPAFSPDIEYTIPPYAYNYVPGEVLFGQPMCTTSDVCRTQPFPTPIPLYNTYTPTNPNTTLNWPQFEPIDGDPSFCTCDTHTPYTEEYFASFQRQFKTNVLLSVSYIGSQSHHQLEVTPFNSGNPTVCAQLNLDPATPCGPNNEALSRPYCYPEMIDGAEQCTGFGGDSLQEEIGNSNYNALEVVLRYTGRQGNFLASYTYSKCLTDASALTEEVLGNNLKYTYGLCSFDIRHNFVVTYRYNLPIPFIFGDRHNRLTDGWTLSGTTRISTGLPVTILDSTDESELGTNPNGVNNNYIDRPNCSAGPLQLNYTNPNQAAFNTSLFSQETLGVLGNCGLTPFSGPGLVNFDMALAKVVQLSETKSLEFRAEAFNVFNTPEFFIQPDGDPSVQANYTNGQFGQIVGAMNARVMQFAAKFIF